MGRVEAVGNWDEYFTEENINFHVTGRDELTMVDEFDSNATILPAYIYKPLGTEYAYIADSGALDIGVNDKFTFYMWIKNEDATGGLLKYFGGKLVFGNFAGRYGIYCDTDNKIRCQAHPSGGIQIITSNVLITDQLPHFIIMEIDQTVDSMRLYIDNVRIGAVKFTGTFSAMSDIFKFYIGAGNNNTGGIVHPGSITKASFSDVGILLKLLTPTEKTNLYNRVHVTGHEAYYPNFDGWGSYLYDASGNGYHLTTVKLTSDSYKYGSFGSRYGLDKGYSLYESGLYDVYVPYAESGVPLNTPILPVGATLHSNHAGNTNYHNLSNSLIYFQSNLFNRSNTAMYNNYARDAATYYYDATNDSTQKHWHASEFNNILLQTWCNTGYKGLWFVKIDNHSYKDRSVLKEILSFASNKTGSSYAKIVDQYCGDYVFAGIYENDHIFWKSDTSSVNATRDSKVLRKYGTTMFYSLNEGLTYPYSKTIAGLTTTQFAHIFENGNILWADYTKLYLSTDSLQTVSVITPKDVSGDDYTPTTMDNFDDVIPDQNITFPGYGEIRVWCNYSTTEGIENTIMNVWYTKDNGLTVKSAFKLGVTLSPLTYRHGHAVNYQEKDTSFWFQTGDHNTVNEENHWIKGKYNWVADTWTWTTILSGYDAKSAGMAFYNDSVIWSSDRTDDPAMCGIRKLSYNDIANAESQVIIFKTPKPCMDLLMSSTGKLIASDEKINRIITSNNNGHSFVLSKIYGIPTHLYITIRKPATTNGWILNQLYEIGETSETQYNGKVLWVKIKP